MGKKISSNETALRRRVQYLTNSLASAQGKDLSAAKLKSESDYFAYMQMLKGFAQRYCVMIVANDTPVGPSFTAEHSAALGAIGLNVDLLGKYRCAYAALIDAGTLVFEQIKLNTLDTIDERILLGEDEIRLESIGFNAHSVTKRGSIQINGVDYSIKQRGLAIVIYDKVTKTLIDSIVFDTYADNIFGFRPAKNANMLHQYAKSHPEVSVVCFRPPSFPTINLSPGEQIILDYAVTTSTILDNLTQHIFTLNHYFDEQGIAEVLTTPTSYHDMNGVRQFEDRCGRYVNIAGGHRVTSFQPNRFQRTIFCVGGCSMFGIGTDDSRTLPSYLQDLFNRKLPSSGIIVQNYGFYLAEVDKQSDDFSNIVYALPVKPGDIVLYMLFRGDADPDLPCIDLAEISTQPRTVEIFFDIWGHFTPDGYRLMAESLFEELNRLGSVHRAAQSEEPGVRPAKHDYGFDANTSNQLTEYKKILIDWYDEMFGLTVGAVVMNCNPFTLGHRYLIEKALEQCDYLAIFVVQEDKSIFPFEDRIRLVDEGVADLKNVVVIPSGQFVLSSLTFSEYFNKSELQDRVIDSSLDVLVFAREIAPCLHITKRFVGEEPFDSVTRQYNETMKKVLPEYGIELIEIPRAKAGEEAISASHVRALLKENAFHAIQSLVPESTFRYLHTVQERASSEQSCLGSTD